MANAKQDLARYTSLAQQDFASHQQVDTQQAHGRTSSTATIAGDDAAIETAQLNLSYCYITSPIEGRVGLRLVDPGNLVHASDATGIVTDHPDPADLGAVHAAAGQPAADQRGDGRQASCR